MGVPMFAGLGNLHPWVDRLFHKVSPAAGDMRELWDAAIYFALLLFLGYVVFRPTSAASDALRGPFMLAPMWAWGLALSGIGVVCAVLSYWPEMYAPSRRILIGASLAWALMIGFGIIAWDAQGRALISVLVYVRITSQLMRTPSDVPRVEAE